MKLFCKARRGARRPGGGARLYLEPLEARSLPSTLGIGSLPLEAPPNDTLDQAAILGLLSPGATLQAAGVIGDSPAGAADVDWYQFTLDQPLQVSLQSADAKPQAAVVLSLYNSDPFNFTDPSMQMGTRLLAQDQATADTAAAIDRPLSPGTYYVAVSGAGNLYFHPFLAGSGYDGQTGPYTLQISGTNLGLDPAADGPSVLTSDPANGAVLSSSPAYLHIDLSSALDTGTTPPDQIVQLTCSPDGHFDGSEPSVPLNDVEYSAMTNEIVLIPGGPLAPGYYKLSLISPGGVGASGDPTDFTTPQPWEQNWSSTFQVVGIEGNTGPSAVADDTAAGAHQLGDVTNAGLVQVAGSIGEDPTALPGANPAADMDLYHFQVTGPGSYALTSEVFAGRIGSTLDAALSLFRRDPVTNQLQLVAANDNPLNTVTATNGWATPLFSDPVLFAGLTAGDYYLAVTSSPNVPDPLQGIAPGQSLPGVGTVFDPNVSHSGTAGFTTGNYVLSLLLQAEAQPPRVLAITPAEDTTLEAPPTELQVQFSEPVNLQQLAYQAFQTSSSGAMPAVFITGSDGTVYNPRFESFDPTTNTATLLMLDALPNGTYELHLSGASGLADLSGAPLAGNDPGGDYVVSFSVSGPPRGTNGDPLTWSYVDSSELPVHEQTLGVLFPDELQSGVNLVRQPIPGVTRPAQADAYDFQVLQGQQYLFSLSGANLPAGTCLKLMDADGNLVSIASVRRGQARLLPFLQPGSYRVIVQGWTAAQADGIDYKLTIKLLGPPDNPVPLTSGPAPAIRLRLNETITPPPTPPAPPVSLSTNTPPRLTLPDIALTPDNSSSDSTVQVNWQTGTATSMVGPSGIGVAVLNLIIKAVPQGDGPVLVTPAVRITVPDTSAADRPVSLPFSLLAVLGTSPAGNLAPTGGSNQSVPQVTLQLPDAAVAEGLLRLIVFTPLITTGGEDPPAAPAQPAERNTTPPSTEPPANAPNKTRFLDAWFSRLGWLDWPSSDAALLTAPQERPDAGEESMDDSSADTGPTVESLAPAQATVLDGSAWSLALLGVVAGVGLERPRHRERETVWHGMASERARV